MLDINFIREHSERVATASRQKGYKVDIKSLLKHDDERRELKSKIDSLRQQKNEISDLMKGGKPSEELIEKGRMLKVELADLEARYRQADEDFIKLIKAVPNIPESDVPVGDSEDKNIVSKEAGEIPKFDFKVKSHWELAEIHGWIDKERAAKVTGSRFAYLKGDIVFLQMAIMRFVMDTLASESALENIISRAGLDNVSPRPFIPVLPPYMIRTEAYDAMDRLEPSDDRYKIEGEDLWLQGSAEHVLGSMHSGEIFEEKELPLRYVGYATSFRREAGTYGKDTEGIIRMHQFDKLEMESFTTKDEGRDEHLFFIAIQEYLLEQLQLPYRVMMKCTADIGKPNARGVDMDVWMPGQGKYRETHTADYMTDYQARRLQTRVRRQDGNMEFIHTNDATAFALGRIMVAIIENYQTAEGKVRVPEVLKPYLSSREFI